MDFDEVVPIEVQYQLLEILKEPQYDIYKLLRYNFLDGEPWPNLEQEYKPRLYKKESVFYENRIHTEAQPVEGFTVSPDDPTIFFNHYKTRKEMNDCNARYKAIVETELAAGNEKYEKLRNWYK